MAQNSLAQTWKLSEALYCRGITLPDCDRLMVSKIGVKLIKTGRTFTSEKGEFPLFYYELPDGIIYEEVVSESGTHIQLHPVKFKH